MWIDLLNEGISLFLLIALGFIFYQGFRKNQAILGEREELLKRYHLFRGDRQVRLKIYEGDEKIYQELLKNISTSCQTQNAPRAGRFVLQRGTSE